MACDINTGRIYSLGQRAVLRVKGKGQGAQIGVLRAQRKRKQKPSPWYSSSQVFLSKSCKLSLYRPFVPLLPHSGLPANPDASTPKQGMSTEGDPRFLQPGRLPRRVGRAGVARRGDKSRHFSFPSTCPTSAPGLGLRLSAA